MDALPAYWTDPVRAEFDVRVQKCRKVGDSYHIVIPEPVVKPVGGGQAGDKGILVMTDLEIRFSETITEEDEIALVTSCPLEEGTEVKLILDMDWRTSMMRNHTGEHLFAKALLDSHKEMQLGRIWIDGNHGTIEIWGLDITPSDIFAAETKVQQAIADELEVKTDFISPEEIDESVRAREGVTSKHDILRVVEIEDFDKSACSGIHVKNTRDIGVFKIVDYRLDDETTHLEFLTGPSALALLSSTYNQALDRKRGYPFEIEQLGAVLDKSKSMREDYDELVAVLVTSLSKGGEYVTFGQSKLRAEYLPGIDSNAVREISNRIEMPESSVLLLFTAVEQKGKKKCNLIVRTKDMPNDAPYYVADSVMKLGGRGGGSGEVYTGGFSDQEEPKVLFESLVEMLKNAL